MAPLNIQVMGGIFMGKDGQRLDDKLSFKALAMICLLLTTKERRLRKSRLISLLWPDNDEEAARNNLRYNVWNIKKVLPKDEKEETLILSNKDTIYLNPAFQLSSDILCLKEFRSDKDYSEAELLHFRSLFCGEYLEGFYIKGLVEYFDMMLMERIACQNLQIVVLERLYEKYATMDNQNRCIEVIKELLFIDPYNEGFACRLMEHMLSLGQHANTASFYKKFAANIRKDLNIPPSPELSKLYEKTIRWNKIPDTPEAVTSPKEKEQSICIEVICIKDVEYFFLAECIRQILKNDESALAYAHEHFDEAVLEDLSFICSMLCRGQNLSATGHSNLGNVLVPQVRVLHGFYDFLAVLSERGNIEINVKNFENMDIPSKNFITIFEQKNIKGVAIYR